MVLNTQAECYLHIVHEKQMPVLPHPEDKFDLLFTWCSPNNHHFAKPVEERSAEDNDRYLHLLAQLPKVVTVVTTLGPPVYKAIKKIFKKEEKVRQCLEDTLKSGKFQNDPEETRSLGDIINGLALAFQDKSSKWLAYEKKEATGGSGSALLKMAKFLSKVKIDDLPLKDD